MLSPVHPSVRLSVRRVYHRKTVEVRIVKLSPYGNPISLVFAGQLSSRNSKGLPERGRQTRDGWVNQQFSIFKREYLENGNSYG